MADEDWADAFAEPRDAREDTIERLRAEVAALREVVHDLRNASYVVAAFLLYLAWKIT